MGKHTLRAAADLSIFLPSSQRYRELTRPYNEAASDGRPSYVAVPKSAEEVQEVIEQCRAAGLSISVHSTGHDFEGRSLSGDVVIHMGALTNASYDPMSKTLTVGGGARVYDVNRELARFDRAISTGTNQDVGIAGLALGGGAAYTARMHGLTCDALLEVELCSFAGERLRINDQSDPGLMRLLRGAGGGIFGVVTHLKFKTYETGPVTGFSARWDIAAGAAYLADLEEIMISAPQELSMRLGANVTGAEREQTLTLSGQLQGGDESRLAKHFGAYARGASWTQATIPYYEAMAGALHQTSGGSFKIKSRFAMKPIGRHGLADLLDHMKRWTPTRNEDGAGFGLFAWGGRIRDFPGKFSCMPGRFSEYLASFDTSWTAAESAREVDSQLEWVSALDSVAAPHLSDLSYLNFPDSDEGKFDARHLRPILQEVKALAAVHDPCGLSRQDSRCHEARGPLRALEEEVNDAPSQ